MSVVLYFKQFSITNHLKKTRYWTTDWIRPKGCPNVTDREVRSGFERCFACGTLVSIEAPADTAANNKIIEQKKKLRTALLWHGKVKQNSEPRVEWHMRLKVVQFD